MKILLFGEYSGLFNCLKDGLIKLGHQVFLASDGDLFKNYSANFRWDSKRDLGKFKYAVQIVNILSHKNLFVGYDVVFLISARQFSKYALPNRVVYDFLIRNNQKIYLCGAGLDAYAFDYWHERVSEKYHHYTAGYLESCENPNDFFLYHNENLKKYEVNLIKKINGYIPIWYEYAEPFRNFINLKKTVPIPINLDKFKYQPNIVKSKIIFFHGLSRPCKGGKYIIAAFNQLRVKYANVAEFICAGGLPFDEYMQLIDRSNVILDDVNGYSLGMNALLSMAKGKIVMGGAEPIANQELGYIYNPAYNLTSNVDQIVQCIEHIVEHKSEIEEMGYKSRKFVEEYHDYIKIAEQYVDVWEKD